MRDYIHVVDLAQGHVAAQRKIEKKCGCKVSVQTTKWPNVKKTLPVLQYYKWFEDICINERNYNIGHMLGVCK